MKNSFLVFLTACILFFDPQNCLGQIKIISTIYERNIIGDYQGSHKQILKYWQKGYDTTQSNFIFGLADYYSIAQNPEFNPYKSLLLLGRINCQRTSTESVNPNFLKQDDCEKLIKERKDIYVKLYFFEIYNSSIKSDLERFIEEFSDYPQFINKISDRLAEINYSEVRKSRSRSNLVEFMNNFPNSTFTVEAQRLIEELDYTSALESNSIESCYLFLKAYPKSTFVDSIRDRLEVLTWEKVLKSNTKLALLTFIKEFPSSSRIPEARKRLNSFVDVIDVNLFDSQITTFHNEKLFYKSSKKFKFLKINKRGNIGLALGIGPNDLESKGAYLVNMLDGKQILRFTFDSPNHYCFSANDSLLIYCDNSYVKQIDCINLEITVLFKYNKFVDSRAFESLMVDKFTVHLLSATYNYNNNDLYTLNHYTYDLKNGQENYKLSILDLSSSTSRDVQTDFQKIPGDTRSKLIMLKLLYRDRIEFQPLNRTDLNSYVLLEFPKVYIIDNERFILSKLLTVAKNSTSLPGVFEKINIHKDIYRDHNELRVLQFTKDHQILFSIKTNWKNWESDKSLFILELNSEYQDEFANGDEELNTQNLAFYHLNPEEIYIEGEMSFAQIDETSGNLFYQTSDYRGSSDLHARIRGKSRGWMMGNIISVEFNEMDEYLLSVSSTHINSTTLATKPLETLEERYTRLKEINDKLQPVLDFKRDSLYGLILQRIYDSIQLVKYSAKTVFDPKNYIFETESWRLVFENPFGGKSFAILFPLSRQNSLELIENDYSGFDINVSYYFNLLSWSYEPILLDIVNKAANFKYQYIVPFSDQSLLNNLALTSNHYLNYFEYGIESLHHKLVGYNLYDVNEGSNVYKYLVHCGKPKIYFSYGNNYGQETVVRSLDDWKMNRRLGGYKRCCPDHPLNDAQFTRLNEVPYFLSVTEYGPYDQLSTGIYEVSDLKGISQKDDVKYPNGISPNKKYKVDNSGIFNLGSNAPLLFFKNATGNVYWDCNSDYFGIGAHVFPFSLIEKLLLR